MSKDDFLKTHPEFVSVPDFAQCVEIQKMLDVIVEDGLSINRDIKMPHVNGLRNGIKEVYSGYGNLLFMDPIRYNTVTGHLIDGAHRIEAYKKLLNDHFIKGDEKILVIMMEVPADKETQVIIQYNTHSKPWNTEDFIGRYKKEGNTNYVKLEEFAKTSPYYMYNPKTGKVNWRYSAAVVKKKSCQRELRDGLFSATESEFKQASKDLKDIEKILKATQIKGCNIENVILTWNNDFKGKVKDVDKFVKALKADSIVDMQKTTPQQIKSAFALAMCNMEFGVTV